MGEHIKNNHEDAGELPAGVEELTTLDFDPEAAQRAKQEYEDGSGGEKEEIFADELGKIEKMQEQLETMGVSKEILEHPAFSEILSDLMERFGLSKVPKQSLRKDGEGQRLKVTFGEADQGGGIDHQAGTFSILVNDDGSLRLVTNTAATNNDGGYGGYTRLAQETTIGLPYDGRLTVESVFESDYASSAEMPSNERVVSTGGHSEKQIFDENGVEQERFTQRYEDYTVKSRPDRDNYITEKVHSKGGDIDRVSTLIQAQTRPVSETERRIRRGDRVVINSGGTSVEAPLAWNAGKHLNPSPEAWEQLRKQKEAEQ